MIIKILPEQIPKIWEVIKFVVGEVNELNTEDLSVHLNGLLQDLLSSKAQCWVRLNDARILTAITITGLVVNKNTGGKKLIFHCLYSFLAVDDDTLKKEFSFLKTYAEKEKCSCAYATSENKRVWEILSVLGFTEKGRNFYLKMGE